MPQSSTLYVMGETNLMFLWSSPAGILGNDQRGVCTDDGELLLLCHPRHQKPPHLHAILNPQGAQDGQLPQPSGKGLQSHVHTLAFHVDCLDFRLKLLL